MAQQLVGAPMGNGGFLTRCSSLAPLSNVLLLGDAGHSMWPSLGQGANCALEDCTVLGRVLDRCEGMWVQG